MVARVTTRSLLTRLPTAGLRLLWLLRGPIPSSRFPCSAEHAVVRAPCCGVPEPTPACGLVPPAGVSFCFHDTRPLKRYFTVTFPVPASTVIALDVVPTPTVTVPPLSGVP